jgi:alkylation response protein AidB-like acyl-CoA dehydrogenase
MDFGLTTEQRAMRDAMEKHAAADLNDDLLQRDAQGAFSRQAWHRCAQLGLPGLRVPVDLGGQGADALTTMVALEALGYGCRDNGLIFALNAHMWAGVMPLLRFGSDAQQRRYLPGACDGSVIIAHAASEPGAGSDIGALACTADVEGERYVLTGTKSFVTNAPVASLFVVLARAPGSRGWAGLTAFLVERDTPGLSVGGLVAKMGLRTATMADVVFDGCVVDSDAVLGRPGTGMAVFSWAMTQERSFILASAVGTMRRHWELCAEYARQRAQFGRPIGGFQAVSDRIVGMRLRWETSQLMVYRLGWLLDQGWPAALEAALTKLHVSECFVQSGLDAVQVHGGYGYLSESGLERDLRDAIGGRLYSGTSEIQRIVAARAMGLR